MLHTYADKIQQCRILSAYGIWCWSVEKCGHQRLKTAAIGVRTPPKSENYLTTFFNRSAPNPICIHWSCHPLLRSDNYGEFFVLWHWCCTEWLSPVLSAGKVEVIIHSLFSTERQNSNFTSSFWAARPIIGSCLGTQSLAFHERTHVSTAQVLHVSQLVMKLSYNVNLSNLSK